MLKISHEISLGRSIMAQVERPNMAEGTGVGLEGVLPGPQTGSAKIEGQVGIVQRPWYISPEYDSRRAEEYQVRKEGQYSTFRDPLTGKEVARILEIAGGAGIPSVVEMVEKAETDAEKSGPGHWMIRLQELHDLSSEERATRINEYNEACEKLHDFAHPTKLAEGRRFEGSSEVAILEDQLITFEKEEIETGGRTETEKEELQGLLDDLERHQNTLFGYKNSLDLKATQSDLFTKKEWDDMQKKANELQAGIDSLVPKIQAKTSLDFLSKRAALKTNISQAKKDIEERQEIKDQKELDEQRGEVDDWVKIREAELLLDKKPTAAEVGQPPENLPNFGKVLEIYDQQKQFKDEGSSAFSQDIYNQVEVALAWYFHEGREKGVLSDGLEGALNKKYEEWASDLLSHREINSYDGSVRVIQKTFPQVQDEIIEYFDNLLASTKASYVEHDNRWSFLRRRGVDAATITRLKGVRVELVRRAQILMEDSLQNLSQQLDPEARKQFSFTQIKDRISGEWNVHRLEREIRAVRENQQAQERSRPLFRHESYYSIDLLGTNRAEVELGADEGADYIIGSATTFSLEVVRQRMELLTQGLERKIGTIEASEHVSRQEATKIIREIQRRVTNKVDFYILDWTAANLLMDQFAGYYSDRMRMDGDQKLKSIPAMNEGRTGLAIHWLTSSMYELYHRPQGFRGQLYNDDQTHKTMRGLMKEQIIQRLMKYELKDDKSRSKLTYGPTIHDYLQLFDRKGVIPPGIIQDQIIEDYYRYSGITASKDPTEFFNRLSLEHKVHLFALLGSRQQIQLFNVLTPSQRVEIRQYQYDKAVEEAQDKDKNKKLTLTDLAEVREAAIILADEKNHYQTIRNRAESAFDTADKVLNIFGDAAFLGAPSIIMENGTNVTGPDGEEFNRGDYISINDYKIIQKYAILSTDHKEEIEIGGKKYKVQDNEALIRWRSKMFITAWRKASYDREKARGIYKELVQGEYKKISQTPPTFMLSLAKGFEETGLTEKEWDAFKVSDKELREKGYQVVIGGKKFEEIVKMDELQPVLNNFLVDYKSSESEINDPYVIEKAARGKMVSIANIRKRLGFSGRQGLEGTTQQQIDEYTQRIEDSRSFDAELERLAYFAATHNIQVAKINWERGKPVYKVSPIRIDYGYQRQSWGVKRLHHLKAFWYTNLRRTVPRAEDLIHAVPITLTALDREHSFDTFLQMCWDINKMESIDNPSLVMTGDRHKDQAYIRGRGEGSVGEGQGGLKKAWGFWEKPLVDANSLWKLMKLGIEESVYKEIQEALKNPAKRLGPVVQESLIQHLQDVFLSRVEPLLTSTEKSLGEDRQALSAGSGYEENEKFGMRFLEWLMSEKSGNRREQGGMEVNAEIQDILKLITTPNSYRQETSIWDEVWRKLTPSHNPALPTSPPKPTQVII